MNTNDSIRITVQTRVNVPVEIAWKKWTNPADIMQWNFASDDWHCPSSQNDLRAGGTFSARMEAKDGSFGFDFGGEYIEVKEQESIHYKLGDGREVKIQFLSHGGSTEVVETFDAENQNSADMQRQGWQAILENYKRHAEKAG